MIRHVKDALAFLFGAIYASSWWLLAIYGKTDNNTLAFPALVVVFGSIWLILTTASNIADHWND